MSQRDDRVDLLRGFALLAIFVDHVPHNPLSLLTLRSFSFADAAELFFFLSGFTASIAYLPHFKDGSFFKGAIRIWRRAWSIYSAQIILFVFLVAEVAGFVALTGRSEYLSMFRVGHFFAHTEATLLPVLLMNYQPGFLDVLPLYVLLFLVLPWLLYAANRNVWPVLAVSVLLYVAAHLWGWSFKAFPWHQSWQFNPFAWQFIFVLGMAVGVMRGRLPILSHPLLLFVAVVISASVAVVQFSAALSTFIPAFPTMSTVELPIDKPGLGWPRLFSFLAIAVLVATMLPKKGEFDKVWWLRSVIRCGRNPLPVFCSGVLLAGFGPVAWDLGNSVYIQFAVGCIGIGMLLGLGSLLERIKDFERAARPFGTATITTTVALR